MNLASIYKSVLISIPIGFDIAFTNAEAKLKQRRDKVVSTLYNVVSMLDADVVLKLCNVENPTSDFASFLTSDQRYFNIDSQIWNNVDPTLKCWLENIIFQ